MAMKTLVKSVDGKTVVAIEGQIDFESSGVFKEWLHTFSKTDPQGQVVFDLGALQFVGSSGITQFLDSLLEYGQAARIKPLYSNVGSEFRRMMKLYDKNEISAFHFWDSIIRPYYEN